MTLEDAKKVRELLEKRDKYSNYLYYHNEGDKIYVEAHGICSGKISSIELPKSIKEQVFQYIHDKIEEIDEEIGRM